MEKQKKILDASVLVKWFAKEEYSDKALKLKQEHLLGKSLLIIPDLTILEVMNSLRYKDNDEKILKRANEDILNLQIKIERINKYLVDKAVEISYKYKITIYDAIYVALAQMHGCFLVTADKELFKIPNVVSIENI